MSETSILMPVLVVYALLVFIKTMLCYADSLIALGTINRRTSPALGVLWFAVLLVSIPLICAMVMPWLLYTEKLSSFGVYGKRKVMRDILTVL